MSRFPRVCLRTTIRRDIDAFCNGLIRLYSLRRSWGFAKDFGAGKIAMRRLLSMTAFGFGFYYLWYNTDVTVELMAIGAMGIAILLEFAGAD
jgi:hypothetical protein